MKRHIAAVVVTDNGYILPYTVESTKSQCNERAVVLWGQNGWDKIQELGGKIVQCEIVLIERIEDDQ